MSCKHCREIVKRVKRYGSCGRNDPYIDELAFDVSGHESGWNIPIHFCPNCGDEIKWDDRPESLGDFYNKLHIDTKIFIYDKYGKFLIESNNGKCGCENVIDKYKDIYTYSYTFNSWDSVDIVIDKKIL